MGQIAGHAYLQNIIFGNIDQFIVKYLAKWPRVHIFGDNRNVRQFQTGADKFDNVRMWHWSAHMCDFQLWSYQDIYATCNLR